MNVLAAADVAAPLHRRRQPGAGSPGRDDLAELDAQLTQRELGGLVVLGETAWPFLGARTGASVAARVKAVLDPHNRLPAL